MAKTLPVKVHEINQALWGVEDWVRAVREVLAYLPEDTTIQVPRDLMIQAANGGGTIRLIRGCPPPLPPDDGCDDDEHGHGHGKDKDKDKDKDKKKEKKPAKGRGKTK